MRSRTDGIHSHGVRPAMSGRVRKDLSASFLTGRFVIPVVVTILVAALVVWLVRGR